MSPAMTSLHCSVVFRGTGKPVSPLLLRLHQLSVTATFTFLCLQPLVATCFFHYQQPLTATTSYWGFCGVQLPQ